MEHILRVITANPSQLHSKSKFWRETLLHDAARDGNAALVAELVKRGAPVNAKDTAGETPLMYAAKYGQRQAVLALIGLGAAINDTNVGMSSALHKACLNHHADIARDLVMGDADIKLKDNRGRTPHE
jgi:ankyrin repeat protein